MAIDLTIKQINDNEVEIYINDLLFAKIYEVSPTKAKGKYKWSFTLEHLPVEICSLYKSIPDALIAIKNYTNLINRAMK